MDGRRGGVMRGGELPARQHVWDTLVSEIYSQACGGRMDEFMATAISREA